MYSLRSQWTSWIRLSSASSNSCVRAGINYTSFVKATLSTQRRSKITNGKLICQSLSRDKKVRTRTEKSSALMVCQFLIVYKLLKCFSVQWAATRPDLFPSDVCDALTLLHSGAPSHTYAYTKQTIEQTFKRPMDDIFSDFEQTPVASGSIAQVHRGVLNDGGAFGSKYKPGTVVAVKVNTFSNDDTLIKTYMFSTTCSQISAPTSKPWTSHQLHAWDR